MNREELQIIHEYHLRYDGKSGEFNILGALPMDVSSLRVSIHITALEKRKQRFKIDLFDYTQIQKHTTYLSEQEEFNFSDLEQDFLHLTELLEKHREQILISDFHTEELTVKKGLSLPKEKEVVNFLKKENLLEQLSTKLGNIGIVGEEQNRLLLFILGTSYKTEYPMHGVMQSQSGAGKSHLINTVADCFPKEDVISLSRISSKSLYHFKRETLNKKLILIQDFDGLDDEARYAFRELQSYGFLTSSITSKDAMGNPKAIIHTVEGSFASFGASTKPIYTDNASRSVLLKVDESVEQTKRILLNSNRNQEIIIQNKQNLRNIVRVLKPAEVHNPFSEHISISPRIPMARRLNNQLKQFINQITFIHQYQRAKDDKGRLITTQEDVSKGIELFFDALWIKVDDLEPSTRFFFEKLKKYIDENNKKEFTQREVRTELHVSRSSLSRYIQSLTRLEYIQIQSGTSNKGYTYSISHIDDIELEKQKLKTDIMTRLSHGIPNAHGTLESPQTLVS